MQTPVIFCARCGFNSAGDAQFCQRCGAVLSAPQPPSVMPVAGPHYGGFWIRVVAALVDFVLPLVALLPMRMLLGSMLTILSLHADMPMHELFVLRRAVRIGAGTLLIFAYRTVMESSSFQATLGKLAVGLKITDERGHRISFGRAAGRYFAKWVSVATLGLGFAMAGFDEQKQALHDRIAGTLVMYRR